MGFFLSYLQSAVSLLIESENFYIPVASTDIIFVVVCFFFSSTTMPLSTISQSQDEQYVLLAILDNARNLSNILKAITCKDHAIFTATANGLKVTVEDSKCMQANAFIQVGFSADSFLRKHSERPCFSASIFEKTCFNNPIIFI